MYFGHMEKVNPRGAAVKVKGGGNYDTQHCNALRRYVTGLRYVTEGCNSMVAVAWLRCATVAGCTVTKPKNGGFDPYRGG